MQIGGRTQPVLRLWLKVRDAVTYSYDVGMDAMIAFA